MVLPAPHLDDRRFQELVDEAKRWVQTTNPLWTDHNVSDPGVTLIETFALMVDQLIYRLNRVPERLYVKFLDLIGVRLHPPGAARVELTFFLSAPQAEPVRVPATTRASTTRTEDGDALVFATVQDAVAVPTQLACVVTAAAGESPIDRSREVSQGEPYPAFGDTPTAGDCLYVGLDRPAPGCVVNLRFDCPVSGVGVRPNDAPLRWEAFTADAGWVSCDVERDETWGFNRPGDVALHISPGHVLTSVADQAAGWLRCRLVEAGPRQFTYRRSPVINRLEAFTIGVDCAAINAELVDDEQLGVSDGTPGQRFAALNAPMVPTNEPLVLEVAERPDQADGTGGWIRWTEVDSFAGTSPEERAFMVDLASGEIRFGPSVRLRDGSQRQYGMIPPHGAPIRLSWYWYGGGSRGNVRPGSIAVMKQAVKLVAGVTNRRSATGGVDAEPVSSAMARGPIELRTTDRAVTGEDYELLVQRAAPEVARVRCLTASEHGEPGAVRVLLVPHVPEPSDGEDLAPGDDQEDVPFSAFTVTDEMRRRVRDVLDQRRVVSTRVVVDEPVYRWVRVAALVRARRGYDGATLRRELLRRLHQYLHPVRGGPDGTGWPFGRPLHNGELYVVFQRAPGVEYVEAVRLFSVNPNTRQAAGELSILELAMNELLFLHRPDVVVEEPP